METVRICICIVNEDVTCCNIVAEILQSCTYEVLNVGRPLETLHNISVRKDEINLVLTNLHRIQAQGPYDMLQHIQNTLELPTFLMSPDSEKIELKCQENSFAAYLLHSLDSSSFFSALELALVNAMGEPNATDHDEAARSAPAPGASSSSNLAIGGETVREKRERTQVRVAGDGDEGQSSQKKSRMVWTPQLHEKFVQAVNFILPERPVPKKIAQVMNIPSIKRENVASHLQKYRIALRKEEERVRLRLPSNGSGMAYFHPHILGLGTIAPPRKPPSSINAKGPSRQLNSGTLRSLLRLYNPNSASQNGNYSPFADSQGNDQSVLQQMLNLHPGNLEMNSGFGAINGYQERSMLLGNPGSKNMSDSTLPNSFVGNFLGFRLTDNGKSIEFGQPSAPGSIGSENQSLYNLIPAAATSQIQVSPIASIPEHASSENHNQDISDPYLDSVSVLEKTLAYALPVDPCTATQYHPLPQHASTIVNEEALQELSTVVNNIMPPQQQAFLPQFEFGTPSSWDLSAQSAPLPTFGEQQLSLLPYDLPRHDHFADHYHAAIQNGNIDGQLHLPVPPPSGNNIFAHSFTMPASQQENLTVSSAEILGHDASIQEPPAPPFQNSLNQESSMPSVSEQPNCLLQDANYSVFPNGAASPTAICDEGFDETFFNQGN